MFGKIRQLFSPAPTAPAEPAIVETPEVAPEQAPAPTTIEEAKAAVESARETVAIANARSYDASNVLSAARENLGLRERALDAQPTEDHELSCARAQVALQRAQRLSAIADAATIAPNRTLEEANKVLADLQRKARIAELRSADKLSLYYSETLPLAREMITHVDAIRTLAGRLDGAYEKHAGISKELRDMGESAVAPDKYHLALPIVAELRDIKPEALTILAPDNLKRARHALYDSPSLASILLHSFDLFFGKTWTNLPEGRLIELLEALMISKTIAEADKVTTGPSDQEPSAA